MATFALAAAAAPAAASGQLYLGEVSLPSVAVPQPVPACFERHYPCERGAIATAPAEPMGLGAMPSAGFVKASAPLPARVRQAAPHRAASLSILFRNFRE